MSQPICTRCVMDTSDSDIVFDDEGVCNRCTDCLELLRTLPDETTRETTLAARVAAIKTEGQGRSYDCVLGVSGGVDSTYAAFKLKQVGLRPLAVHMDNGWNSELAVSNIEKTLQKLGIDLHTDVLDWPEFRDLQLAFLRASVSDAEIPTDHAIAAVCYRAAARVGVKTIVTGANVRTEAILPSSWTYGIPDWRYIRGVHARFGDRRKLKRFPHLSLYDYARFQVLRRIRSFQLLDYVPYDKAGAIEILEAELGWRPYSGKHHESIYTRFFQSYILPRKFGIDKRKAHLSTLICSGQITREQALAQLEEPIAPSKQVERDRLYVIKKLGISAEEFDELMKAPIKTHRDYPNNERILGQLRSLARWARRFGLLPRPARSASAPQAEESRLSS